MTHAEIREIRDKVEQELQDAGLHRAAEVIRETTLSRYPTVIATDIISIGTGIWYRDVLDNDERRVLFRSCDLEHGRWTKIDTEHLIAGETTAHLLLVARQVAVMPLKATVL